MTCAYCSGPCDTRPCRLYAQCWGCFLRYGNSRVTRNARRWWRMGRVTWQERDRRQRQALTGLAFA